MATLNWIDALPAWRGERALVVQVEDEDLLGTEAPQAPRLAPALAGRFAEVVEWPAGAAFAPGGRLGALTEQARALADAEFDLVALVGALRHLDNPSRALEELHRALRPGGVLLLAEPIAAWQGPPQDQHVAARQWLARFEQARGGTHAPLFQRLQLGSLIQGLGLVELGFQPFLADPAEAEWDVAERRAAAAPWLSRLKAACQAADLGPAERAEAEALVFRLETEGLRSGPRMIVFGRVPDAP